MNGGIEFTEIMEGNIYTGNDIDDFNIAARAATDSGDTARFYLSVNAWDSNVCKYSLKHVWVSIIEANLEIVVSQNDHLALLTGTVTCRSLSRDPLMVRRGTFHPFNEDFRSPDTTNLFYKFDMVSTSGEIIHFDGYKVVNSSVAFSPLATWKATSTLYVTLTSATGSRIGRGMLHISPTSFGSEALTLTSIGQTLFSRLKSSGQFLSFFAKQVAKSFLGPLNILQFPSDSYFDYSGDKTPPIKTMKITAFDGVQTTLTIWAPAPPPEFSKPKILFIPGAAVNHQIFALPTIRRNAVEYFTAAGHQVFVITHRTGKTIAAQKGYTTFDARLDIKAALEEIRKIQGSDQKIYVVAHCAGSVALSMALLDKTIPADWILEITASNVFPHPNSPRSTWRKRHCQSPLPKIYQNVAGSWFSCTSSYHDTIVQKFMNQALRFYPIDGMSEICNSVVCHRSELVFGRSVSIPTLPYAGLDAFANTPSGSGPTGISTKPLMKIWQDSSAARPWLRSNTSWAWASQHGWRTMLVKTWSSKTTWSTWKISPSFCSQAPRTLSIAPKLPTFPTTLCASWARRILSALFSKGGASGLLDGCGYGYRCLSESKGTSWQGFC